MRLLIIYGSTEGHTHDIALYMAETAAGEGHSVEALNASALPFSQDPYWFDAVIVGASVHQGRHQSSVREFVLANKELLEQLPSAFFSVSLSAAVKDDSHQADAQAYVDTFLADTQWQPNSIAKIAGAVRNAEYDYFRKMILKVLARQLGPGVIKGEDVVYTDWDEVAVFVQTFLAHVEDSLTDALS